VGILVTRWGEAEQWISGLNAGSAVILALFAIDASRGRNR
jgi:hypothetical protein